jgi:uncharacterized protein YkwD
VRRLLAAFAVVAATLLAPVAPSSVALAAPVEAPGAVPAEGPTPAYLDQLLNEINARRAKVGAQPLIFASPDANLAVSQYLTDLTPQMISKHACFHGNGQPVSPSWDYVEASGFKATVGGEVLGCPGTGFYWTPQQIADGWWGSPSHFHSLYADFKANAVACGAYSAGNNGKGYQTVACVTFHL